MCTSMELLFNFRNVYSLFGMRRMLHDSLRWLLFHHPLNRCYSLVVVWMVMGAVGGLGSDRDLERPVVPVRTTLSSPDQSNIVTLAPPGNHEVY